MSRVLSTPASAAHEATHPLLLLACPVCRKALRSAAEGMACDACARAFPRLPCGAPVLLPDASLDYEPPGPARTLKAHVQRRFAEIDESLPRPFGDVASFLNLGYVPNENETQAARGPLRAAFNQYSTRLLFEVIGRCDLDGRSVLDLGCGRGGGTAMIQEYYSPSVIVGLDLSPANVAFCTTHHELVRGRFVVGDVEHLPFAAGSAEVVLNLESSHYYPDRPRFYDEVHRVLAGEGLFLYADILEAGAFAEGEAYLRARGFEILRNQDITSNVLLSCAAIARLRDANRRTGLYESFLVLPGTPEFLELQQGQRLYKILTLRKKRLRGTGSRA